MKYTSYVILHIQPLKMEQIECSETSANHNHTPGKYSKEYRKHSKHSESLKSRIQIKQAYQILIKQVQEKIARKVLNNQIIFTLCALFLHFDNPYIHILQENNVYLPKLYYLILFDIQYFDAVRTSTAPGSSVGIATGYGLAGLRSNPGVGENFRTCPDRPWGLPRLLYNGYRVFPGVKSGWSVTLTSHPFQCPGHGRVEIYRYSPYGPYGLYRASVPVQGCTLPLPIPLLPLWAVRPVQSLSACTRVHFTFTLLPQQKRTRSLLT